MAIDSAQKRSVAAVFGWNASAVYPTGTVDVIARGGVMGVYYEAPAGGTGRRQWRRLTRKVISGS
jgi:hypothetical protein